MFSMIRGSILSPGSMTSLILIVLNTGAWSFSSYKTFGISQNKDKNAKIDKEVRFLTTRSYHDGRVIRRAFLRSQAFFSPYYACDSFLTIARCEGQLSLELTHCLVSFITEKICGFCPDSQSRAVQTELHELLARLYMLFNNKLQFKNVLIIYPFIIIDNFVYVKISKGDKNDMLP